MMVAAVVAVTSQWQWQSCYVAVAVWHGSGGQSYGLVVVVAVVASWQGQQLTHHSGCMAWWQQQSHGMVVVAAVTITSWRWQLCYVIMVVWHNSGACRAARDTGS
jgi:hypothetical protein